MASTADFFRVAYEETPRPEAAATTAPYRISTVTHDFKVVNVSYGPGVDFEDTSDEIGLGEAIPEGTVAGYAPAGSFEMRMRTDDLVFLLPAAGWTGVVTAGNGTITDPDAATIPTGMSRWVFDKLSGTSVQKTFQTMIGYYNEGVYVKGQGVAIPSFAVTAAGRITGDLAGMVYARVADPNVNPAMSTLRPMTTRFLNVTTAVGSATPIDFTLDYGGPVEQFRGLNTSSPFATKMYRGDERQRLTGTIVMDLVDADDVDMALVGSTFDMTARWRSDADVVAGYYPSVYFKAPNCQVTNIEVAPLSPARRRGATISWMATDDGTGVDARWTVVTPTLAAYQVFA